MKTKIKPLILLLCILAMPASAQENIKKFGIGLGYHSASIVGDSVRPFDISFRYRINERHTLTLYAPLWIKNDKEVEPKNYEVPSYARKEDMDKHKATTKHFLWGIGIAYDYSFYQLSHFAFFAGAKIDYQEYKDRNDLQYVSYTPRHEVHGRDYEYGDFRVEEVTLYDWNRARALSLTPNAGVRFTTSRLSVEGAFNLAISRLIRKAYGFSIWKERPNGGCATWEENHADKHRSEYFLRPELSIHMYYYF